MSAASLPISIAVSPRNTAVTVPPADIAVSLEHVSFRYNKEESEVL